ncbi:unnamed protein product, partial [Mesorhabditis spiculigera]
MKTLSYQRSGEFARAGSPHPKTGRVRKATQEWREEKAMEEKLRKLVGHSEEEDQLALLISAIERIRNLQQQLQTDKENDMPDALAELMESVSTGEK